MKSIWLTEEHQPKEMDSIENKMRTDIVIIGAGIFGLTAAYYLTQAGAKVIVLEKARIGTGTTGHTTGKITSQHGLIYHYLAEKYGMDFSRGYYQANEDSIKEIKKIIYENQIICDFETKNHMIFTQKEENVKKILEEFQTIKNFSDQIELKEESDLNFEIQSGIMLKEQAQFNPVQYVKGLARRVQEKGNRIICNTICYDFKKEKEGYQILTQNGSIFANKVILASHYPFVKYPGFYFLKMYQASSYIIGIETKSQIPNEMYFQEEEPRISIRTAMDSEKRQILLMGGEGHKTGKSVTEKMTYGRLKQEVKLQFPDAQIRYWWSSRDCITLDKIPYIGKFSNLLPQVYIATGFNKWGMTTSNLAARIITDEILGKENQYQDLFEATRMKPIENRDEVKNILAQSIKSFVVEKTKKSKTKIEEIKNGEGGVIQYQGKKIGIYRDEKGKIYGVKPICTHLGCVLNWNDADKTWDCPCHGSRYRFNGENLSDPGIKGLERICICEEEEDEKKNC